jgi:hemerythrin-like metal-binding protein
MTNLFTWTKENSVGVNEMDTQHQHIFTIINNLADSISKSNAQGEIDKILAELVEYSTVHFGSEERYFKMFNYIYSDDHVSKHHMYNAKISEFYEKEKDLNQKRTLPYEIINFLKDWWINHINIEDKKYTDTFHQHGLF